MVRWANALQVCSIVTIIIIVKTTYNPNIRHGNNTGIKKSNAYNVYKRTFKNIAKTEREKTKHCSLYIEISQNKRNARTNKIPVKSLSKHLK